MLKYSELISFINDNGERREELGRILFPKEDLDLLVEGSEHADKARALLQEAIEAGAIQLDGSDYSVTLDVAERFGNYDPDQPLNSGNSDPLKENTEEVADTFEEQAFKEGDNVYDSIPELSNDSSPAHEDVTFEEEESLESTQYEEPSFEAEDWDEEDDENDDEDDDWDEEEDDDDEWDIVEDGEVELFGKSVDLFYLLIISGGALSVLGLIFRMISTGLLSIFGLLVGVIGLGLFGFALFKAFSEHRDKKELLFAGGGTAVSLLCLLLGLFLGVKPAQPLPNQVEPGIVEETTQGVAEVETTQAPEQSIEATTEVVMETTVSPITQPSDGSPSNTFSDNVEISIQSFQIAEDSQGRIRSRLPVTITNITTVPLAYNFTLQAFDAQGNPVGSPDYILGYTLQPNNPQVVYAYEYRLPDEIDALTAPGVTFAVTDISSSGLDVTEGAQ